MAERFAAEDMRVVLADIEQTALEAAASEMRAKGASILAVRTDVSDANDVEGLAQKTLDAFGAVHVLCNNAGVVTDVSRGNRNIWEHTSGDWEWVLGVNLWGVIHGIRAFVPTMLQQDVECHIVNTSSCLGLLSVPYVGPYNVTKHAVVTLSETLHRELMLKSAKVGVSVLCPGWVESRLANAARNRPAELKTLPTDKPLGPEQEMQDWGSYWAGVSKRYEPPVRQQIETVLPAEQVAGEVLQAIREERFYILTHPGWTGWVRNRMEDVLEQRNPDILL